MADTAFHDKRVLLIFQLSLKAKKQKQNKKQNKTKIKQNKSKTKQKQYLQSEDNTETVFLLGNDIVAYEKNYMTVGCIVELYTEDKMH